MNDQHTIDFTMAATPLGSVRLAACGESLCGLWFEGQKHLPRIGPGWRRDDAHPLLALAHRQLLEYFERERREFALPLAPHGTAFQREVWQALRAIGCGEHISYGALARRLARPSAVRAVAAAVGRNPISVIVPCHRVLGADGALTGYAGGLERKRALLALEAAAVPSLVLG